MEGKKLLKTEIVKLIQLYRSYPILWDMNDKSYRRNDLKSKAYEVIAKEMNLSVEVVQKKIKNLRTTYTNEKRKCDQKKSGSGAENIYRTTLSWYGEMSFLDTSIKTRKTVDNSFEHESITASYIEEEERQTTSKRSKTAEIENVLQELANEKETEYTLFGKTIAKQLDTFRPEVSYALMVKMQTLIGQAKIDQAKENTFRPINPESLSSEIYTSTPSSDILSLAMTDAEIDWDE